MDATLLTILASLPLVLLLFILPKFSNKTRHLLPPGPRALPLIGNLHQLDTSDLPTYLWKLSKQYGPLMFLRFALKPTIVVSSAKMAKEVMKTQDLVFSGRTTLVAQNKFAYNNLDIVFAPYSEEWRELKKMFTLHLVNSTRLASFRAAREEEVDSLIKHISSTASSSKVVNLSETLKTFSGLMILRVNFGKRYKDELEKRQVLDLFSELEASLRIEFFANNLPVLGWVDKLTGSNAYLDKTFKRLDGFYQQLIDDHLANKFKGQDEDIVDILLRLKENGSSSVELTFDRIKALLVDVYLGGTDASAAAVVWAMTLLMKHPTKMERVQEEVRRIIGTKGKVDEGDIPKLTYLKAVIKESMRLFPPFPLLIPHETRDRCVLNGYEIPAKTLVLVNAWAIGRDPDCWEDPEEFLPERFLDTKIVDYRGLDFEMVPFGEGRRSCPGMSLGAKNVEMTLSNLLYSFDWEMPDGTKRDDIDTLPTSGVIAIHKKNALCLVAKPHSY